LVYRNRKVRETLERCVIVLEAFVQEGRSVMKHK